MLAMGQGGLWRRALSGKAKCTEGDGGPAEQSMLDICCSLMKKAHGPSAFWLVLPVQRVAKS